MHLVVKGRVQGVGFRWYSREAARRLGLSGWVRNLPGGDVEAEAEGEKTVIERFVEELKSGPSFAEVDAVEVRQVPAKGETEPFDIY